MSIIGETNGLLPESREYRSLLSKRTSQASRDVRLGTDCARLNSLLVTGTISVLVLLGCPQIHVGNLKTNERECKHTC